MILRVSDIFTSALRFVGRNRRALFDIAIVPVVLALLNDTLLRPLLVPADPMIGAQLNPLGTLVALVASFVLSLLPMTLFAVAWTRYCLLTPGLAGGATDRWGGRETRYLVASLKVFLLYSLALGVVLLLVSALFRKPMPDTRSFVLSALLLLGLGGSFFARLSLILPAAALDLRFDLRTALRYGQGNGWRLFSILLLLVLLGVFLMALVSYVATLLLGLFFATPFSLGPAVVLTLLLEILNYLLLAPLLAAMAFAFRDLTGWNPDGSIRPLPEPAPGSG